jgi:MFS family permease
MRLVRTVLGNRGIAQLEAGSALSSLGAWTFSIALALYAYYEDGAGGVALAVAVRMLPAALLGPLTERLTEDRPRRAVLAAAALLRFALLEAIAIVVANEMAFALLLTLAAAFEVVGVAQRPARMSMLVELARTPAELAAASAWRFADGAGFVAGGALAAILLAHNGLDTAFAAAGVPYLGAALLAWRLPATARAPRERQLRGGIAGVARQPWMRLRLTLFGASALVQSMLELLLVIVALDLLRIGSDGVGWLRAALAAGALAGGAAAVALLRRGRLAPGLVAGLVLAGAPLALVAAWPHTAVAVPLLILLGGGYALVEAALLILTQRLAQPAALARLARVEEIAYPLARAAGTGLAAWLVVGAGEKEALVVAGLLLPAIALLAIPALRRAERAVVVPDETLRVLSALPPLATVPRAVLENLALCAAEERYEPDQAIDGAGLRAIASGTVEVAGSELGPGTCFGEATLLRDGAEAVAAKAVTPVTALAIRRADFIAQVRD